MKLRALPTDEARIAAALEFVQSEIRYFSVSLGESSHRPASPSMRSTSNATGSGHSSGSSSGSGS